MREDNQGRQLKNLKSSLSNMGWNERVRWVWVCERREMRVQVGMGGLGGFVREERREKRRVKSIID